MSKKEFQRFLAFLFRRVIAQGSSHKLRRALADVAGDGVLVQLFPAHLAQHGVDGEDQVALGIDERAVQVEDQHANRGKVRDRHEPAIVI